MVTMPELLLIVPPESEAGTAQVPLQVKVPLIVCVPPIDVVLLVPRVRLLNVAFPEIDPPPAMLTL